MESSETKTQVDIREIKTEKTSEEVSDINAKDDLTSELNRTLANAAAAAVTNNGCSSGNVVNIGCSGGDETISREGGGGGADADGGSVSIDGSSVTVAAAQLADDEHEGLGERTRDDEQNEQCQQEQKCKTDKIREVVEQATSEDSKKKIDGILSEVQQLSDLEKLLLYLRLPAGTTVEVDPLKQAFISSLGNRFEVTQTVTWIQTHLEEDPEVSLPKQEVYDGYCEFCQRVKMKPLSTADFGKVMKQVFAGVRPRRLGTRGNSRYCYAGLRKKVLLDSPKLPDLSLTHEENCEDGDSIDPELTGVSSHLVREWAEKLLGQKFSNLKELACHLVENAYVNNRSVAAFSLLSYLSSVGLGNQSCLLKNQCTSNKHRETQLQLQRKLHEREQIREQKKKLSEQRNQVGRKEGVEKPSPKLGRKSQLGKTQNENLRMLLSTSSSVSVAESESHETSLDSELSVGGDKLKPSSNLDKSSLSLSASVCVSRGRRMSGARSGTPISFFQKSVGSSATRRKSAGGETIAVDSRRPKSSLENGSLSCRPVQSSEITLSRGNRHCSAPQTSVTDLLCSSSETNKAGKVLIPRMKSGQSPKMCLPPTSIIFFPQISGTLPAMSEYNNNNNGAGSKVKPKYKPIQPKPVSRSSSSDDGRTIGGEVTDTEGGGGGVVLCDDRNGREGASCVTPAGSQLTVTDGFSSELASSSLAQTETSSILVETMATSDVVGKSKCPSVDNGSRSYTKGGRRKHKRGMEPKEGLNVKKKRPCLQSTECISESSATLLKFPVCNVKNTDSPQGEMSISTLENDAWMEYLGGGAPSTDQEEELLQYFEEDVHIPSRPTSPKRPSHLSDTSPQSTELSQLRRLLERNLQKASQQQQVGIVGGDAMKEEPIVTTSGPSSADTMPTLRLLLSDRKQQQQCVSGAIIEGDGMMSDTCLSHASSRMQSPVTVARTNSPQVPTSATVLQSQQYGQNRNSEDVNVSLVEKDTSNLVYETEMSSHEDVWSQGDFGMVKPLRVPDEHMFSSDSSSGCHIGPLFQNNEGEMMMNSRSIHFDDGILMGDDRHLGSQQQMTPDFRPYNGGSYTVVPSYASSNVGCGQSSVPPSPNTRRRAFNFMPISPRNTPVPETCSTTHSASHSPLFFSTNAPSNNGSGGGVNHAMSAVRSMALAAHSQSVSATTSPFVSPRSTPSSHCRSRHNSGQASSSTFGTPRATPHPIYTMEQQMSCLSSPFASPHPTPVHFSRSRHNSSQNVPRSGLIYSSAGSVSAVASRSRHASDIGMAMMSPGSAPMSPLELGVVGGGGGGGGGGGNGSGGGGGICDMDSVGNFMTSGHFTLPSVGDTPHMRSRHNSNSSVPPNSPRSAPMSPMVSHCSVNTIQDVNSSTDQTVPFGKPMLGSSPLPLPPPTQRQFQSMTEATMEDQSKGGGHDLQWQMMQEPKYQHGGVASRDVARNPSLQQSSSWPTGVPQRQAQIDPRLASRQRHASMGATVHHHPNPIFMGQMLVNPPPMTPSELTHVTHVGRVAKKPPSLPILDAIAANRCRSVPIYQMLENAIQQSEQVDSPYNDVMMSRSYPATPIGQHTFSFDGSGMGPPMCTNYSPMVGGGGGKGEQPPSSQQHQHQPYNGEQVRNLSESLDLPQDQFQDMLQTTLDDLSYVDDISKIAQELEQYTSSTQS